MPKSDSSPINHSGRFRRCVSSVTSKMIYIVWSNLSKFFGFRQSLPFASVPLLLFGFLPFFCSVSCYLLSYFFLFFIFFLPFPFFCYHSPGYFSPFSPFLFSFSSLSSSSFLSLISQIFPFLSSCMCKHKNGK